MNNKDHKNNLDSEEISLSLNSKILNVFETPEFSNRFVQIIMELRHEYKRNDLVIDVNQLVGLFIQFCIFVKKIFSRNAIVFSHGEIQRQGFIGHSKLRDIFHLEYQTGAVVSLRQIVEKINYFESCIENDTNREYKNFLVRCLKILRNEFGVTLQSTKILIIKDNIYRDITCTSNGIYANSSNKTISSEFLVSFEALIVKKLNDILLEVEMPKKIKKKINIRNKLLMLIRDLLKSKDAIES